MAFPTTTPIPLNTFKVVAKNVEEIDTAVAQVSEISLIDFGISILNFQDRWILLQADDNKYYYFWFNIDQRVPSQLHRVPPELINFPIEPGVEVALNSTGSISDIRTELKDAIDNLSDFSASLIGNAIEITNTEEGDFIGPQLALGPQIEATASITTPGVSIFNPATYNTVYTAPAEVSTILLMCQITNREPEPVKVDIKLITPETPRLDIPTLTPKIRETLLIKEYEIPPFDAFNPLTGRLVLPEGSQFQIKLLQGTDKVDLTLSILENAVE